MVSNAMEWETRFEWTNTNTLIGLAASGGPLTDPGNITFTAENSTDEDQEAIISITPWSYYRSRSRWFWQSWPAWGPWQQLCSGNAYSVEITVYPFRANCPTDYNVSAEPGVCTATIATDDPTFECSPLTLTWTMT